MVLLAEVCMLGLCLGQSIPYLTCVVCFFAQLMVRDSGTLSPSGASSVPPRLAERTSGINTKSTKLKIHILKGTCLSSRCRFVSK